jgi:hypothetical protein
MFPGKECWMKLGDIGLTVVWGCGLVAWVDGAGWVALVAVAMLLY